MTKHHQCIRALLKQFQLMMKQNTMKQVFKIMLKLQKQFKTTKLRRMKKISKKCTMEMRTKLRMPKRRPHSKSSTHKVLIKKMRYPSHWTSQNNNKMRKVKTKTKFRYLLKLNKCLIKNSIYPFKSMKKNKKNNLKLMDYPCIKRSREKLIK